MLLPNCLEKEFVTREELKQEFVTRGESEDLAKAGFALSVISGQIGLKKRDFLRQVIGYDYPNRADEKDNYFIRADYRDLVREVLERLNDEK